MKRAEWDRSVGLNKQAVWKIQSKFISFRDEKMITKRLE